MMLFLATAALTSCSKSDDNNATKNQQQNKQFNPPTWIQGNWTSQNADDFIQHKFTTDNYCTTIAAMEQCFKEIINISVPGYEVTYIESSTDKEYKFSITQMESTINYHFVKISDNIIEDRTGGAIKDSPRLFTKKK